MHGPGSADEGSPNPGAVWKVALLTWCLVLALQVQVGGDPGVVHADVERQHRGGALRVQLARVQAGLRAQLPRNCPVLLSQQALGGGAPPPPPRPAPRGLARAWGRLAQATTCL